MRKILLLLLIFFAISCTENDKQKAEKMFAEAEKSFAENNFGAAKIEGLLPLVTDCTPANNKNAVELSVVSAVVIEYAKHHYPIGQSICAVAENFLL